MEFLIDPNIAYILIVAAVMLALMTILVPGTGLPEIGMLICLGLAWYELTHLEPNLWALLVVALTPIPFIIAVRQARLRLPLLALTILMLAVASFFLFIDKDGRPAVNFLLAGGVSILSGLFIWFAVERGLKAQSARPVNDPDSLVGRVGEARTEIYKTGSVQAEGELWTAHSDRPIPAGSQVLILKREGFVLRVKKIEKLTK
jgi:membrane-bound serine protease (ClpP class)